MKTLTKFRVYLYDTTIVEVNVNDEPVSFGPIFNREESEPQYIEFDDRISAMEYAKAGAITYINHLVDEIQTGIRKLKEYRAAHYEDLNVNLLDSEIRKMEREMR